MTAIMPTNELAVGRWTIDPVNSSIRFALRHLTISTVRGRFDSCNGAITVADDGSPSVTAEVAVRSFRTGNVLRSAGVRRLDPFDAKHFPVATFVSTAVTTIGDSYALDGDLTLKGVTRPVCLDLAFHGATMAVGGNEVATFSARVVLNRRDFGIELGPPTPGAFVGLDVAVDIQVLAVREPSR
jgi:polyisoprenoid-binding protein YceI